MKKSILVGASVLSMGGGAFGASPAAIDAALQVASKSVTDIQNITEIQRCRSLDCYVLKFEGTTRLGAAYIVIQTEREYTGNIKTTIIEQSK
jgi:hypothetical protein